MKNFFLWSHSTMTRNRQGRRILPGLHWCRPRPAFTLIESVLALVLVLMSCQLIVGQLRLAQKLQTRMQMPDQAEAGMAMIQLENFLEDKQVFGVFEGERVVLQAPDRSRPTLIYDYKKNVIKGTNMIHKGYVPLLRLVQDAKFSYDEPLLKVKVKLQFQPTMTRYFIVPAKPAKPDE